VGRGLQSPDPALITIYKECDGNISDVYQRLSSDMTLEWNTHGFFVLNSYCLDTTKTSLLQQGFL